jgi:hypothetical protein
MRSRIPALRCAIASILAGVLSAQAHAGPSPEFMDSAAQVLALVIIVLVPIGGIVLFWLVHVLPEKIAEKRHHPQKDAIHTLCLLSLVFGGLLWPLAWLWAFTKPVFHQLAYGRDKHEDFYDAGTDQHVGAVAPLSVVAVNHELAQLRRDLDELERRGELPGNLQSVRERLSELERRTGAAASPGEGA